MSLPMLELRGRSSTSSEPQSLPWGVFFAGVDFAGHGSTIGEIWSGFRAFFHSTDLVDLRVLSSVSEAKDLRSLWSEARGLPWWAALAGRLCCNIAGYRCPVDLRSLYSAADVGRWVCWSSDSEEEGAAALIRRDVLVLYHDAYHPIDHNQPYFSSLFWNDISQ